MRVLAIRDAERRNLVQGKGSYSDRKRALKWVLLVTVPRTVLDDATRLRTASVRQDQRKYCVLLVRQLANGLRPSCAQQAARRAPRPSQPPGRPLRSRRLEKEVLGMATRKHRCPLILRQQ